MQSLRERRHGDRHRCSEGWYGHRLLDWGADAVVGVDVREQNVRRANLVRDDYGISPKRLRFETRSVQDLDGMDERFDVALCLGLIYHLENPIGALRAVRRRTTGLCVVETQAALVEEARYSWGTTGEYLQTDAVWATYFESHIDQLGNPIASHGEIVSLIPNRAALVEAMQAVGMLDVKVLDPPPGAHPQFVSGDRLVAVGRTGGDLIRPS